jgi:hypothetical protein
VSITSTGLSKHERARRRGPDPRYLEAPEAAAYLRLSEGNLAKRRVQGGGPRFAKMGNRVVYDRVDLDAWLASFKISSTAERQYSGRRRGRPPKQRTGEA